MTAKSNVAKVLRRLGLDTVVDSKRFRKAVGAPIYKRHETTDTSNAVNYTLAGPQVTVVVPAYNVENYLSECLESILGQSYSNLDVLVVDDGSTDGTASVADDYARRHKRVRVIHKQNAGLGAARNTGLENSTNEFITFVDSDDTIPPGTYERAMSSLNETGSDVCISSVARFDSKNRWLPFWVHLAHEEERLGVSGKDFPPIMWDVFAWNKVYRRDTWDRLVGSFPEGTLYEDQECTAKLYIGGAKLDILKEVGYNWRLREDSSSITQQKTSISDLNQRLNVAFEVRRIVGDSDPEYLRYWYAKTLGEDLYYYIREVPRADPEFFDVLSEGALTLWNEAPASAFESIDPVRRLLTYYVAHQSRTDLHQLLVRLEQTKNSYRGVLEGGRLKFSVERADGHPFEIPADLQTVAPDSVKPQVELTSFNTDANGNAVFTGFGYLPNFDLDYGYSADLFNSESQSVSSTLEVNRLMGPVPARFSTDYNNYQDRRFELKIPKYVIDELADQTESSQSTELQLRIHLHLSEFTWTASTVRRDLLSSAGYPLASNMTDRGARVAVQGDPRENTSIVVLKPKIVASQVQISHGSLHVRLRPECASDLLANEATSVDGTGLAIVLSAGSKEVIRSSGHLVENYLEFELALPRLPLSRSKIVDQFQVHIVSASGMRWALAIDRCQATRRRDGGFSIGLTGFGYAEVNRAQQAATADQVDVATDGTSVRVTGTFTIDPNLARSITPTFALVGARNVIHPSTITADHSTGTFDVQFSLTDSSTETSLVGDRYVLQLLLATGKAHPPSAWISASYGLEDSTPYQTLTPTGLLTVNTIGTSRSVRIDVDPPLDPGSEIGSWNQAQNSQVFVAPSRQLNPSSVLFESFSGNSIADSPLALDREIGNRFPEVRRLWTVRNRRTVVPDGAVPVIFGSREWFEAASSASVLINNNNFPYFFNKLPEQFYIQTWHGTPLKKIGRHVPAKSLSLSYRQLMAREADSYWDLLLAQSAWAGETLKDAFEYDGSVLAAGYPRNDILAQRDELETLRDETRRHLGINPGQRAVLYAPTWRDNLKEPSGHYSSVDFLDVSSAAKKLGRSSSILYRGHSNALNAAPKKYADAILDVSRHPNINALIAASDVLITDYSSIMFDYVVTGKPIIFLCPDLSTYRDSVRGFYFDFSSVAPGPMVHTGADVIDILKSDQIFSVESTERYSNFVKKFAGLDDGHAAQRVIDEVSALFS
ncbi:bifunctional glycosyltransferase family 2 protein/CDP-glycerol:glycerophosphate glycerophosphotransferase [Brevibacterium sediminis]|uniref:bifunctional glycosyltransferase/CDP-glycerol:glycerophosphate glycerophosphotransferase n=1 Tax=Brevibacterium sediminis TaxID=1857024 RepID=UPI0021752278|nr:bifunctional glycosyltransferase family 2 protein/CDP-glycerol:glycerophosphate glycerophosphotransferase [Brevibacterium sediminis]MCS4594594.1 bifunctional glycosyltransferase family 2 protein/CDP-glycerol:glycerophosphate glycerophosphotransferase [Brevibacterium sediminis]